LSIASIRMAVIMFKITHNTIQSFSLEEILLMAAINRMEAKQKDPATRSRSEGLS
jgi:hypothetical protein